MLNRIIFIFFIAISLLEIFAEYLSLNWLVISTKPLLMPLLLVYVVCNLTHIPEKSKIQLIAALIFSSIGDTLLIFSSKNELFFLLGLSMFLITHVFYTLIFVNNKKQILGWRQILLVLLIIVSYYFSLMYIINPKLSDFSIPVYLYGIILSTMLFTVFMADFKNQKTVILIGAIIFVFSDSLIALNKFYFDKPHDLIQPTIMITYILGQFCIVHGLIKYLRKSRIYP